MNTSLHNSIKLAVTVSVLAGGLSVAFWGCRGDYADLADGNGDLLTTVKTLSHFQAFQIDPRSEDSAGPQFVVAEDLNADGLVDLVSAWNQTQPVQVHIQGRTESGGISFETTTLAGNIPVVSVAGLATTDFDRDGNVDIAVLLKDTLLTGAGCLGTELPEDAEGVLDGVIVLYLGPDDPTEVGQALAWEDQFVKSSYLAGLDQNSDSPEDAGFTKMAVGDVDADGDMDIVVAWNSACSTPPAVLVFTNDGPGAVRDGIWPVEAIPDAFNCSALTDNCAFIKDVALGDLDRDGDLDFVVTYPAAKSMNVRWYRNPLLPVPEGCYVHDPSMWTIGTIGQVATGADIVRLGDIDRDGIVDVVVRSTSGRIIQWLKGPECPTTPASPAVTDPFANIPWQVFTLAEFTERTPQALAMGDLNFDGQLEIIASAGGGLAWFDSQTPQTVFDQWTEILILDDDSPGTPGDSPATTDPSVDPQEVAGTTSINSVLVVDLDRDGANDLIVTLDRSGLSGLSNDALVWFRNTKTPPS